MDKQQNTAICLSVSSRQKLVYIISYLKVVGFVVVHAESSEKFWFSTHSETPHVAHSVCESMAGKLLHLDVVKLPEVTEPLNELRGDAACELRWDRNR